MDTKDFVVERTINAEPERVFAAWTDPELLAEWWRVSGEPSHVTNMDAREGGGVSIAMAVQEHDEPLTFFLTFIKITPQEIQFTVQGKKDGPKGQTMTVTFTPEGDGTLMRFVSPGIPVEAYDDATGGWNQFFNNLERLFA